MMVINRVIVQKLQLRRELRNIVARTGSRRQQLEPATPEAAERSFRAHCVWIGDLVAFVQDKLNILKHL